MNYREIAFIAVVAAFAVGEPASAAPILFYPDAANYQHMDESPTGTEVILKPDPKFEQNDFFTTSVTDSFKAAMTDSKAAKQTGFWIDQGYTFQYSSAAGVFDVNGAYYVDLYKAVATGDYSGGAEIVLRYRRATTDPAAASLFWIQVVDTNKPNGGETIPYPDVYSGANAGFGLPFYYTPAEDKLDPNPHTGAAGSQADIRSSSFKLDGAGALLPYDIAFYDFPERTKDAYWRAELHLASYDPTAKKVTVYNTGVKWGFDVIPEPPAYVFVVLGLLLIVHFRWKLRPRAGA